MTTREIDYHFRVDWDFDGSYTDESLHLISANGRLRLAAPASSIASPKGIVDQMTVVLDNSEGRYSPMNSAGALYSSIQDGGAYHAPCYFEVSIDGGSNFYRTFTGVIKIPVEQGPTIRTTAIVSIDCRGRDETLLNNRVSTTQTRFQTAYANYWNEAEIIDQWLTDAGLSSGSDYVVDEGLFRVPWVWLDDESPIEEIWALAAACGGRFYCDPDGVFRYENAYHWLLSPHTVSQETITESNHAQIMPYYSDRDLYKSVTVETSGRALAAIDTIWQAENVVTVAPNTTKTVTAKMRQPCYSVNAISYTAVTPGGVDLDSYITVTATYYAQRIELSIENAHTEQQAMLIGLQVTGIAVDGRPSQEETYDSDDTSYWNTSKRQGRTRALRSNAWVQTRTQMEFLGTFLIDRWENPILAYRLQGVPGDPQRRLGDRITIDDESVMSSSRDAYVTEITWRADGTGFVQDIIAYDALNMFPSSSYFVLGTNQCGDTEVLFY